MCKHANKSVVTEGIFTKLNLQVFPQGDSPSDKKYILVFSLLRNAVAFKIIVGFPQRFFSF
jgi:hypothetical protein